MDTFQALVDDFFQNPLLVNMLVGILLAGFSCSLLSPLVAVKRMSLAGVGIGGAAFVGVGVALLAFPAMNLNQWPIQVAGAGGALLVAILVLLLNRSPVVSKESVIGILVLVIAGIGMFASVELGVQIPNLTAYLYGTPHVSTSLDLLLLGGLALVVVLAILLFYRPLNLICMDRDYAAILGIPTRWFDFLFVMLMTATILLSIYATGLLFTLSLLILPGLCARLLLLKLYQMILFAIGSGVLSCVAGVALAQWVFTLPASIVLMLIQLTLFILMLSVNRIYARWTCRVREQI